MHYFGKLEPPHIMCQSVSTVNVEIFVDNCIDENYNRRKIFNGEIFANQCLRLANFRHPFTGCLSWNDCYER